MREGTARMTNPVAKKAKPLPRVLQVKSAQHITPNMIRVTFQCPEIRSIAAGCEGANCKLFIPEPLQTQDEFRTQLEDGPRPMVRTYTVRHIRPDLAEMDIDFVDHGDGGPASAWARSAVQGSFCGFAGPGPVKISSYEADWYLLAADLSALPIVAATLEAMPRDAKGIAFFEVLDESDRQDIDAPEGIVQHWLVHPDPHLPSSQLVDEITGIDWPIGEVQTCIAGESSVIKSLRQFLHTDKGIDRAQTYLSGYWKIGLVEDEHQEMKRAEALATA